MTPKQKDLQCEVEPPSLPSPEDARSLESDRFESAARYSSLLLKDADLPDQIADNVVVENAHFERVVLSGSRFKRFRLTDVRMEASDLSNNKWTFASLSRVELINCRVTGLTIVDAKAKDLRM